MAEPNNNVVALASHGTGKWTAMSLGLAQATVSQLDAVCWHLRNLSPCSNWSAQQWMIASTPFRMQLTATRRRLDDLATVSIDDEQNAIRWSFELNDARLEVERGLYDIGLSLQSLQNSKALPVERMRETELFIIYRSKLLKTLKNVQCVIAQRFPARLSDS
jgi:hypothetical protein